MTRRRPQPRDYTIGWIAALPIELAAAAHLLDEEHEDVPLSTNDSTLYKLGRVGVHNIVLACLPAGQIGTHAAATAASWMRSTFTSIQFGLMVGVGGGVPSKFDVRLGDVVVSQPNGQCGGVVQHDFGKTGPHGSIIRTGFLSPPPQVLLSALSRVQANHDRGRVDFLEYLSSFQNHPRFDRNLAGPDILFESAYEHQRGETCENCTEIVMRPTRASQGIAVHYGTIASGNQVMKDGITRDRISSELGHVLCFEMEGAGLMNSFPCLIIRGVCDYADSHKNKSWQPFAAATAASFAKEVLSVLPATNSSQRDPAFDFSKLPSIKTASFDSHAEEHNAKCLQNTRVELRRQVVEWAQDKQGKHLFWLNGMAGTGKSTIARTVACFFKEKSLLGASFFFKRGEGDRGNAARFFSTIASDLISRLPGIGPYVEDVLQEDPWIAERALKDQFERLLLQPLSKIELAEPEALVVVIDALDECDPEEDIRTILSLLEKAKNIGPVSLRVFVTSRPELPIRLGFERMPDGTYQDLVLHEVPKNTIEHDIQMFLRHELNNITTERKLSPNWPGDQNIQLLVQMAVPLFIFATTVCRFMRDKKRNPKTQLKQILELQINSQVSQLEMTYLPILNQIFDGDGEQEYQTKEFQEIVGSIVVLASPLSVSSLANLLATSKEDIHCTLDSLHSVLNIPNNENSPVRLLHLSFRDFLLDPKRRGQSAFWVDEGKIHERLATKCLELLSKSLRQDICDLQKPGVLIFEIDNQVIEKTLPPELLYACRYWAYHLEQHQAQQAVIANVHCFLNQHVLHWLEAMSLIGKVSEAIRILVALRNWAKRDDRMATFLHEAWLFALRCRHMMDQAPLQIYISGLMFAPKQSIFRVKFGQRRPKWIKREPEVIEVWNGVLATLEGHSSFVSAVVFSPDGRLVVSSSDDKTIRLWDTAAARVKTTLEGHSKGVRAVAFSPDSQLVASGSDDKTIRLWDAATGQVMATLEGHSEGVNAVAFSPDSKLVASGSDDKTIRLWDAATGQVKATLEGLETSINHVRTVVFSPDGKLVASGSDDRTIRLWNAATGQVKTTFEGHSKGVNAVAFSPDGRLVASVSWDRTIRLWDVVTGQAKTTLEGHSKGARAVAFSPDSQLVASGSDDKTIRLWDAATGQVMATLEGHSEGLRAVAFSPDGRLVASGSFDKTVRLWDAATGQVTAQVKTKAEGHSEDVTAVVFSSDGQLVASCSLDKTVRLWDAATGQVKATFEGHSDLVIAVAFSPDSKLVASCSSDKTVRLWDAATGQVKATLKGHSGPVITVAFSPDGRLVASGSFDKTIRLWDAATGQVKVMLEGHSSCFDAVVFSPDSKLVASGSDDKTIRLWNAATGQVKTTFEGHSEGLRAVAFSPDSQLVASGSWDDTVRVWDAATGQAKTTIKNVAVSSIRFSSDGTFLDTNAGKLRLPSAMPTPAVSHLLSNSLLYRENWVCDESGRKLLWIPPEYRPFKVAVQGNLLVGGCRNGRVWFFEVYAHTIPSFFLNPLLVRGVLGTRNIDTTTCRFRVASGQFS